MQLEAAALPLVIRERDTEYQFHRIVLYDRLIKVKFALCILLSTTNKMQCYTIFFITVNALHVSGGETTRNM